MRGVADWSFLTNHAWVLLCIAHDSGVRADIAAQVGVTERTAYGIVTDLTEAGYVVKQKDGRRNRYQIQAHLPLRQAAASPWQWGTGSRGRSPGTPRRRRRRRSRAVRPGRGTGDPAGRRQPARNRP